MVAWVRGPSTVIDLIVGSESPTCPPADDQVGPIKQVGMPMVASAGRVPHALETAHRELDEALDEGLAQYKDNRRCSNLPDICRRIERFVDALNQIPGGQDELRRRATLVGARCGPESDYVTARTRALASYRGRPRKLSAPQDAIERLRHYHTRRPTSGKSPDAPLFLGEVVRVREDIKFVLNGVLKLSDAARREFETWKRACRKVEREAAPLKVDGCWFLFRVHEADEELGVGHNLKSVKDAAASLVAWVAEEAIQVRSPTSSRKRRGRPKADDKTQQEDAKLFDDWQQAKESGVYKADFAQDHGMRLKELNRLLNRVARRKSRSDK